MHPQETARIRPDAGYIAASAGAVATVDAALEAGP
jgi:hypothetical protein